MQGTIASVSTIEDTQHMVPAEEIDIGEGAWEETALAYWRDQPSHMRLHGMKSYAPGASYGSI